MDIQLRLASDLDGKISPLIALVAGAIALVYSQLGTLAALGPLLLVELMVVLVYLLGFLSREFAFAPAFPALLEDANDDPAAVKARFLGNLREAYLLNLNSLSIKALYVRCSSIAIFVVGVTIGWVAIGGAPRRRASDLPETPPGHRRRSRPSRPSRPRHAPVVRSGSRRVGTPRSGAGSSG